MQVRKQPLTRVQEMKLKSLYCILWYKNTKYFSQIFKLTDTRFSSYSFEARLHWIVGTTVLVNERSQKHMAIVLSVGLISKVQGFENLLAQSITSDYDTDSALKLANSYSKSTECSLPNAPNAAASAECLEEDNVDDDDEDDEINDENFSLRHESSSDTSDDEEPPSKRSLNAAAERRKVNNLRIANAAAALSATHSTSASTTEVTTVAASLAAAASSSADFTRSPLTPNISFANRSMASSPSVRATDSFVPTEPDVVMVPTNLLSSLVDGVNALVRLQKDTNKRLRAIAQNTAPATEPITDFNLPAARGGVFCIDDITAETPTQFALHVVERMMGPKYIISHRFEQKLSNGSSLVLADETVISNLKNALRARYGQTHWRAVRLSLNQASRDRAKTSVEKQANPPAGAAVGATNDA